MQFQVTPKLSAIVAPFEPKNNGRLYTLGFICGLLSVPGKLTRAQWEPLEAAWDIDSTDLWLLDTTEEELDERPLPPVDAPADQFWELLSASLFDDPNSIRDVPSFGGWSHVVVFTQLVDGETWHKVLGVKDWTSWQGYCDGVGDQKPTVVRTYNVSALRE